MPQGLKKLKNTGGGRNKKHQKQHNRKTGPKKGRIEIAPKKRNLAEATKLKKGLERAIKHNIEQEISKKASAVEPKSFTIFKPVDSDKSQNSKKKK